MPICRRKPWRPWNTSSEKKLQDAKRYMIRWKWAGTVVKRENVQKMNPKFRVWSNAEIVVSPQCHTLFYENKWFYEHGFPVRRDVFACFCSRQGDVNMHLEREVGDKLADLSVVLEGFDAKIVTSFRWNLLKHFSEIDVVTLSWCFMAEVKVEWQLTSPFDPTADVEGDQEGGEEYVCTQACYLFVSSIHYDVRIALWDRLKIICFMRSRFKLYLAGALNNFLFSHRLGISSSQLTFSHILQRVRYTTKQFLFLLSGSHRLLHHPWKQESLDCNTLTSPGLLHS